MNKKITIALLFASVLLVRCFQDTSPIGIPATDTPAGSDAVISGPSNAVETDLTSSVEPTLQPCEGKIIAVRTRYEPLLIQARIERNRAAYTKLMTEMQAIIDKIMADCKSTDPVVRPPVLTPCEEKIIAVRTRYEPLLIKAKVEGNRESYTKLMTEMQATIDKIMANCNPADPVVPPPVVVPPVTTPSCEEQIMAVKTRYEPLLAKAKEAGDRNEYSRLLAEMQLVIDKIMALCR